MLRTSPSSDEMAVIVQEINSIKEKTWDLHGAVLKLHRRKDTELQTTTMQIWLRVSENI